MAIFDWMTKNILGISQKHFNLLFLLGKPKKLVTNCGDQKGNQKQI
jgi:hypothetical protein